MLRAFHVLRAGSLQFKIQILAIAQIQTVVIGVTSVVVHILYADILSEFYSEPSMSAMAEAMAAAAGEIILCESRSRTEYLG